MPKPTLCIIMGGGCGQLQSASGVLRALDSGGIKFDQYLGASAGACITGLHSSGLSGNDITELIKSTPVNELFKFSVSGLLKRFSTAVDYVYDTKGIYQLLKKYMTDEATKKTRVAITQADTYKSCMVNATPITVMASAAIPQIFPQVKIGDKYYVDGGVKNMIPVPKIKSIPEYQHIYMILCPDTETSSTKDSSLIKKAATAFMQTMDRQVTQIYEQGWQDLDNVTVIQPPADEVSLLSWSDGFTLNKRAFEYANQILEQDKY